jgi:hypothetical protein
MQRPLEQYSHGGETIHSLEAAALVEGVLSGHVNYLNENRFRNHWVEDGTETYTILKPILYDPDYEWEVRDRIYAEERRIGHVDSAVINVDAESGRIINAQLNVDLPQGLSSNSGVTFVADSWHARIRFVTPDESSNLPQRVLIDTWRLPLMELSKAQQALSSNYSEEKRAEYSKLYNRYFRHVDDIGLPLEARDIEHLELGDDVELGARTYNLVKAVLGFFDRAVRDEAVASQMTNMSIEAEKLNSDDPVIVNQLKIVLAGLRKGRMASRELVQSPFALLKSATLQAKTSGREKRPLNPEAAKRIAEQIAAGAAVREERARRRAEAANRAQ